MTRVLTKDFLPNYSLNYPVEVFHGKLDLAHDILDESIIFILNPHKLDQNELMLMLQHNVTYIIYKTSFPDGIINNAHPVKLLLHDKKADQHLMRIKGLRKNIIELHIEKNRRWDFLGITESYNRLFCIQETGYCFMEYPIISENALNLDDVFIQESLKSMSPPEIITKYLQIIEATSETKFEAVIKQNAFQKVFKFYKAENDEYKFQLDIDDLEFLVEVLQLERLSDQPVIRAEIIGALTAACAYFVHAGHPESYDIIIRKLMETLPLAGECAERVNYRHLSGADLRELKRQNAFLYYHLTCRIPNQYTIALFDLYLEETEPALRQVKEAAIDVWLDYLKNKVLELSLMNETFLWEFKRDQEIGAMSGTIGLVTLYKQACMKGDFSAFETAEKQFNKAIGYAHPLEESRNINYLVQCKLSSIVRTWSGEGKESQVYEKIKALALFYQERFLTEKVYNVFDVMYSVCVVTITNVLLGEDKAEKLYQQIGFEWEFIERMLDEHPQHYAVYLMVSFLFFAPQSLLSTKLDIKMLAQKAVGFFKLDDNTYAAKGVMDLIALKFMLAHAWYLSANGNIEESETSRAYKKRIMSSNIYSKWSADCSYLFDEGMVDRTAAIHTLQLMYSIPY